MDKRNEQTKQDDPAEGSRENVNDSGTRDEPARRPGSGLAPDPQANTPEDRDTQSHAPRDSSSRPKRNTM